MKTTLPPTTTIEEVILRVDELLKLQQGAVEITQPEWRGGDVEIDWNGAKAIVKAVIGTHRVEFISRSGHWRWEIGIGYPEMPGAIVAGLMIFQRIPKF